jgi:hypothetical protein
MTRDVQNHMNPARRLRQLDFSSRFCVNLCTSAAQYSIPYSKAQLGIQSFKAVLHPPPKGLMAALAECETAQQVKASAFVHSPSPICIDYSYRAPLRRSRRTLTFL